MRPERFDRRWEQQHSWDRLHITPTKPRTKARSWQENAARVLAVVALGFLTLSGCAAWEGQALIAISSALHVVFVAVVGLALARFA